MQATQVDPLHNIDALMLGTVEFMFSDGAETVAEAALKGYRTIGNITELTPQADTKKEDHRGSYRGKRRTDKTVTVEQKLAYKFKADELTKENLKIVLGAADLSSWTQAALATPTAGQAIAFVAGTPGVVGKSYEVYTAAGARVRTLDNLLLAVGATKTFAATAADELLTLNAHALTDGMAVLAVSGVGASGLVAGTVYYVRDAAANTIKLAETVGGAAFNIAVDAGAVVLHRVLLAETDYTADLLLGMFTLLTAQTSTITPYITCPAIAAGDADYFETIKPLETVSRTGMGMVVFYDQQDDNKVVAVHTGFRCELSLDSAGAISSSWAENTFLASIMGDVGEFAIRNANLNQ